MFHLSCCMDGDIDDDDDDDDDRRGHGNKEKSHPAFGARVRRAQSC